jgi:hypothetical protein
MLLNAIHDFGHPDNAVGLKLCRIESVVAAVLVDIQGRVDQERASVFGRPVAVLDVLGTLRDQIGPGLTESTGFSRDNL